MKARGLIDSGGLLALLDHDDEWHARCRTAFESTLLPLATTTAALTEVFHLLPTHEADGIWNALRSGTVVVLPVGPDDMPDIEALMGRYRDRPMDFADATLVHAARREGLRTILTVDDDFLVYRIHGKRQFQVLPPR